jgi:DNA-binding response OmpR family regulator
MKAMKKILVVDDEFTLAKMITTQLLQNGFDAVPAYSGDGGMRELEKDPEINIILTDVNCGEMDGIWLARKIREIDSQRGTGALTPIIFMSGHLGSHKIEELEKLSPYLIGKPFSCATLIALIHEVMGTTPP